jgi:hypothetical protein
MELVMSICSSSFPARLPAPPKADVLSARVSYRNTIAGEETGGPEGKQSSLRNPPPSLSAGALNTVVPTAAELSTIVSFVNDVLMQPRTSTPPALPPSPSIGMPVTVGLIDSVTVFALMVELLMVNVSVGLESPS